ncbi:hypothetical protein OW763_09845 [Clostridium aestuarii]|uniref:SdpI family protein n=1 Tax=Clostridium aestuarii TaxID=338193 RepID=A0ABT4D078_9CLOT|nr:hypothetical protein [Clostridium aestuarii]MCY6484641.1 hypothetical protein [Clostridium aestuarii]
MNITSISLSYLFLGVFIVSFAFFIYYKVLITKTTSNSPSREKIIGTMKKSETWRQKNNIMSYVSVFWAIISLALFIYLKFFFKIRLINMLYVFAYIAAIVISIIFLGIRKKEK